MADRPAPETGPPAPVTDQQIRDAFRQALLTVWTRELDLVSEGVNERAVVARIAFALQAAITSWGAQWRVDVEYNRWRRPGFGVIRKALYVHGFDAADRRPVYPDLILHDPHGRFQERNLLALEAKRGRPRPRDRDFDLAKLRAYLRELHYRQAVYLEFDGCGEPPRLQWFQLRDGQVHTAGVEDAWQRRVDSGSQEPLPGL
ncbi:hypothetical protein ADK70_12165 [Streptomyces rimosus subsp. pseudoverticillatus]|uniref:hypothetical protein n=1 Tax=Streptomyces rimosus TaxID=1927 RepID=UPI0006B278B7|nr:hypothetical protein [Streptomyces rimosus]KOT94441.1 hypothetical protein ADK70_12165 [Streptomyces rimosus subsp. pseudoverticillatus]